jgi:IS30 family transposase
MQTRYHKANRGERSQLLGEMEQVTGLHRKSLIRLLGGDLKRRPRRRQRGSTYGAEVAQALGVIAESWDHLCAERLTPNLVWMAQHLAAHGELTVSSTLLHQLSEISVSTVRRLLRRVEREHQHLPRPGPKRKPGQLRDIPMKRIPWNESEPGHFEVDLVHHSGPSAAGEYLHTLQMVDVATGWSERIALLGRSYRAMQDAFTRLLARLPFTVLEIHPDNGSEFFNDHLRRFWREIDPTVRLSRSRPYHKNDNRFVEQKNASLVRAYFGDHRFDTLAQLQVINRLYDQMWLYYNFFQPVMHLMEKEMRPDQNGNTHLRRRYDEAQTPLDRLSVTNALPSQRQEQLLHLRTQTNPRQLRQEIYDLLDHLFTLPGAESDHTQDVFQTLLNLKNLMKGEALPVTLSPDRTITSR